MNKLLALCVVVSGTAALAEDSWTLQSWTTQKLSDEFFSEGADAADFNRDGSMDVVSGPYWYEGPDFKKRHAYYPAMAFDPLRYSDNFLTYTGDINSDGWPDVLVYGWPGKDASWYENPQGGERFWTRHKVVGVVDNESPRWVDITGDGKNDIVCSQNGVFGFAERNAEDPALPWKFRAISPAGATGGRYTHGLGVGDVNGDGRMDLLEKGGWWEQPSSLAGDPEWTKHEFAFSGPGGSQMYAYDVDGDGDNDVITSLAAHGYGLAWYEHQREGDKINFVRRDIMGDKLEKNRYGVKFSQLHSIDLADVDGDGLLDIVTGKRFWAHGPKGDAEPGAPAVVYWFRTVRGKSGVDFVPYLVHDDSGVGTQVMARDLNGDGAPDIVVGNKKGTHVHIQKRTAVSESEWRKSQPTPRDAG